MAFGINMLLPFPQSQSRRRRGIGAGPSNPISSVSTQPGPSADRRQPLSIGMCHEECMDQQYIISIVQRSGMLYDPEPTIQNEFHLVRFFHRATNRSLNLGYRSTKDVLVADFVFKFKETLDQNQADLASFLRLFGGEMGKRPTPFARLQTTFSQEAWLIDVIRAYCAMGNPLLTTIMDE